MAGKSWSVARALRAETAPLVFFGAALAAKMLCFALLLPTLEWWSGEGFWTTGQWLLLHPQLFPSIAGTVLLLCGALSLLPLRLRAAACVALDFLITTVILADLLHFGYWGDLLSVASYSNPTTLGAVLPTLGDLLDPIDLLLYVDVVAAALLLPWFRRVTREMPATVPGASRLRVALLIGGLICAVPGLLAARRNTSGAAAPANLQRDVAASTGIVFYHVWDAVVSHRVKRENDDPTYLAELECYFSARAARKDERSLLQAAARGSNLIVLAVESLQTFVIDLEVDGQPVAPNLSRLARQSLFFDNFHDQTHLGTTSDAGFMALQSLHPLAVGAVASRFHDNEFHALPTMLAEHGYHTVSVLAHDPDFWWRSITYPAYGFQERLFAPNFEPRPWLGLAMNDRDYLEQTAGILGEQPEPFMAYLLTASSHIPFELPEEERTLELGSLEGTLLGNYLQAIHYTDAAIGQLVDSLAATGLLDRSVLAVFGDHQAFLGASEEVMRTVKAPSSSELDRFRNMKHVPFMVRLPGGAHAERRSEVGGGHVDIAPTLLSLLGIEGEGRVMLGRDLTAPGRALTVFRDGSFTDGTHYYLNRFGSEPTCFDARLDAAIPCDPFAPIQAEGVARLRMSDAILGENLIETLNDSVRRGGPAQCRPVVQAFAAPER
jgi:phosphoglycerol transferase MdoB-like AlkP superfamily enzyme